MSFFRSNGLVFLFGSHLTIFNLPAVLALLSPAKKDVAMARTKPAVLLLAAALLVWVSKLSCDFVAPARTRSSRADTHSLERVTSASSAFQSRFDSFFGSTACLVVLGIASTSTSRKGCRIVGLRAEAKEAAAEEEGTEAAKEGAAPQAESEDRPALHLIHLD